MLASFVSRLPCAFAADPEDNLASPHSEVAPGQAVEGRDSAASAAYGSDSGTFFIQEFRVEGARSLPRIEVEAAVYPFLGPGRNRSDVREGARAAREKAYIDKPVQPVAGQIPQQQSANGVGHLKVWERVVGRLRVRGARYSSPKQIKSSAPSRRRGRRHQFQQGHARHRRASNQLPDRRVTPSLHAGKGPGHGRRGPRGEGNGPRACKRRAQRTATAQTPTPCA